MNVLYLNLILKNKYESLQEIIYKFFKEKKYLNTKMVQGYQQKTQNMEKEMTHEPKTLSHTNKKGNSH